MIRKTVLACLGVGALLGCGSSKVPELPEKVVGSCNYTNNFSKLPECRDYHGEWSEAAVQDDCASWESTAEIGQVCQTGTVFGHCIFTRENGLYIRVAMAGSDPEKCGSTQRGCELFGGGKFVASSVCGGVVSESSGTGLPTWQPPVLTCVDPKPGEPPGMSEGGKVCTWELISGATEPGRKFKDYASCDRVLTQRPYYYAKPADNSTRADERLNDPTYATELSWVKSQIEAAACVCCHSSTAPEGPGNWFYESEGNFINTFFPRGLAMGAGWIDTVGFGAYPPEQNNGFTRATPENPGHGIFPTTDDARMRRFFENELAYRGFTRDDFKDEPYGAGPLDDQRFYQPQACKNGEGVQADGTLKWSGGKARYLYVLEANSSSPAVPPNLDTPTGTLWRVDVPVEGNPMSSGTVRYGVLPAGQTQKFPQEMAPRALESGQSYYLYVTADVAIPITRCLFTAP